MRDERIKKCIRYDFYIRRNTLKEIHLLIEDLDEFLDSLKSEQFEKIKQFFDTMPN